jgi:dTMP kinase
MAKVGAGHNKMYKGKFITFEGSEGSGKSTQAGMVYDYLKARGVDVVLLREPGGVKIAEQIRNILLDVNNTMMGDESETLLYLAARAQLVKEVLLPALKEGKIIICDRFMDSTIAYQGYGNGVNIEMIKTIGLFATQGVEADLTLLFDIDPAQGLSRTNAVKDRIEERHLSYHQKVHAGYLALAKEYPQRIKVVKVDAPKEEIFARLKGYIDELVKPA